MTDVVDGITIDTDALRNFGWINDPVENSDGVTRPRLFAYMEAYRIATADAVTNAGNSLRASSSSALTVGAGSKSLTIETAKGFSAGDVVFLVETGVPTVWMLMSVSTYDPDTGAMTGTVAVGDYAGTGSISTWRIALSGLRGPVATPPYAVRLTFSTTTSDADPGAGTVRLNNANVTSATQAFVDLADAGGVDITSWLDGLDDSTSTLKGHLTLANIADQLSWVSYTLSAVTTASGYRKLSLAYLAGSGSAPFANGDVLFATFSRTGDAPVEGLPSQTGNSGKFLKTDGSSTSWSSITGATRTSIASDYTTGASNAGTVLAITGGAPTVTLVSSGTFGDTQYFDIVHTLTPSTGAAATLSTASGLLDGLSSLPLYPGQSFRIFADGANYKTQGRPGPGGRVLVTAAAGSAVASHLLSTYFDDPQFKAMVIDFLLKPVNTGLLIRGAVSGTVQTNGYYGGMLMRTQAGDASVTYSNASAVCAGTGVNNDSRSHVAGTVIAEGHNQGAFTRTLKVLGVYSDLATGAGNFDSGADIHIGGGGVLSGVQLLTADGSNFSAAAGTYIRVHGILA